MSDKKDFTEYLKDEPIAVKQGRWRKYSHAETEFDRLTITVTWRLSKNKTVQVTIIGAKFWDINRDRANHANDLRLYKIRFKTFKFYGLFPKNIDFRSDNFNQQTKDMLVKRVKECSQRGTFDIEGLNKYI